MKHGVLPLPQPPPGLPHTVPLLSARPRVLVFEDHIHPRYKVQRVVIALNLYHLFPDFSYTAKQKNAGDSLRGVVDDLDFVRGSRLHHIMMVVAVVKRPPQKMQHPRPMYLYVGSRSHDAAAYQGFQVLRIFNPPAGTSPRLVVGFIYRLPGVRLDKHVSSNRCSCQCTLNV